METTDCFDRLQIAISHGERPEVAAAARELIDRLERGEPLPSGPLVSELGRYAQWDRDDWFLFLGVVWHVAVMQ